MSNALQKKLYRIERQRRKARLRHLPQLPDSMVSRMSSDRDYDPRNEAEEERWDAHLKQCVDAMRAWKLSQQPEVNLRNKVLLDGQREAA